MNKILDKNYKFKSLLIYCSNESLEGNKKKYRKVFENKETRYIYAELSFYNKLFDEEDWKSNIILKAYKLNADGSKKELCNLPSDKLIKKEENIVIIRESWGMDEKGVFWARGDYEWEAYIDGDCVSKEKFYVEDGGLVTDSHNPYFVVENAKVYEGPYEGTSLADRKYITQFHGAETHYIFVEFNIKNLQTSSWYCELFFNFYNDAGQLKGATSELSYINLNDQKVSITSGWGSRNKATWFNDKYTVEIVFMDHLIGVLPFQVGDTFIEGIPPLHSPSELSLVFHHKHEDQDVESLEDVMKSLQEMIGLEDIKEKINDYTHYLKFLKLRQEQGFKEDSKITLHSAFMGNPGTGKTTVAKMLGKIYNKMGLLSKGTVLEVGRAELVGKYIGQTAPKVKEIIDKARGGILFIDEAYALARKGDNDGQDFGKEVIEVLLKEMSDGKGDIAIIVAGYPVEMENFLNINPGLKSRFNLAYEFPDYTPQELLLILEQKSEQKNVFFTQTAKDHIYNHLVEVYRNRDKTFGNARLISSLVEEAKMNMGLRIMRSADITTLTQNQLKEITLEDVQNIFKSSKSRQPDIKIDEILLQGSIEQLNKMIGLPQAKNEINELVKLVKFYKESGRDVLNKFSLHTVFKGNPGTGKTTIARIIAQIYKALGILEKGHLVECDRQGLVAGYVGQTAIKTKEMIDKAMGGVLFIDEAYSLATEDEFGKEAIETVLKHMEDHRGHFVVIVAGYPDNMRNFLLSNPGLASRFDTTVHFDDYDADDLFKIALHMLQAEQLTPNEEAENHLKKYFAYLYQKRDKFFGNARSVRKIIDKVTKNQHLRMASILKAERTEAIICTLSLEDVTEFNPSVDFEVSAQNKIGF